MTKQKLHPGATLLKRIVCNGVENHDAPIADVLAQVPAIVDTRPEMMQPGDVFQFGHNSVAIPFPQFWVETKLLSCIYPGSDSTGEVGVLWGNLGIDGRFGASVFFGYKQAVTWFGVCWVSPQGGKMGSVDNDGVWHHWVPGGPLHMNHPQEVLLPGDHDAVTQALAQTMFWFTDFLSVLGCRNIGLDPFPQDTEVSRRWRKHPTPPDGYRYHVIGLRGHDGRPLCRERGEYKGTMPLHVCRGHYSAYGPKYGKGLLFGKYEGMFYIPAHAKGKKENGTVEADYTVD